MGVSKASLVLDGETMIQRQMRLLRLVCRSVAALGPMMGLPSSDVPFFPDEIAGRGPLGGIYTGLRRTRTEFNLFLGCDLPFVEARFLDYLCRRGLECRADVTAPESSLGKIEPLCAVYHRKALWAVRACLLAGENKITRFYSRVRVDLLPWRDIACAGFGRHIFDNMNTPEDYEAAKKWFLVRGP